MNVEKPFSSRLHDEYKRVFRRVLVTSSDRYVENTEVCMIRVCDGQETEENRRFLYSCHIRIQYTAIYSERFYRCLRSCTVSE